MIVDSIAFEIDSPSSRLKCVCANNLKKKKIQCTIIQCPSIILNHKMEIIYWTFETKGIVYLINGSSVNRKTFILGA